MSIDKSVKDYREIGAEQDFQKTLSIAEAAGNQQLIDYIQNKVYTT